MATSTRQSNLFATQDWKTLYTTFSEANFQSYDFETLRKIMVDYIRTYYAEDFNDFIESSEFVALLDLIAFTSQGMAFRTDMNARENFLDTAERRDSVLRLVKQLGYVPNRNKAATGMLKVVSVSTTEALTDINGTNLSRININWNDTSNSNWSNQFTQIINAAIGSGKVGRPYASKTINGIKTQQYNLSVPTSILPVFNYNVNLDQNATPFEVVGANILSTDTIAEQHPGTRGEFGIIFQNDGRGNASASTGFFLLFKQGNLLSLDFNITDKIPNRILSITQENVNNEDVWVYDISNNILGTQWTQVPAVYSQSAVYNSIASSNRKLYSVGTRINDQIDLIFGDGTFADIPLGTYRAYYRASIGQTYRITPADMNQIFINVPYVNKNGGNETMTMICSLQYTVSNSSRRDLTQEIKQKAPQAFYTQGRMVNGEDYNIFPYTQYPDIVKVKSVNRYSSGASRGIEINDPTGKYSSTNIFGDDGAFYTEQTKKKTEFLFSSRNDILNVLNTQIFPIIQGNSMKQFYYHNYTPIALNILNPTTWTRTTNDTTSSTGFFLDQNGVATDLSYNTTNYRKYLNYNSLIKFTAPTGYYYDVTKTLIAGIPQQTTDTTYIWTSIQNIIGTGSSASYIAGRRIGAVTLADNIPSTSVASLVYAPWNTTLLNTTVNTMINLIQNHQEFALTYNTTSTAGFTDPWKIIAINNIDQTGEWDILTSGTTSDSSWMMLFLTDGVTYTVYHRGQEFVFGSKNSVRFLNINPQAVFDSSTNSLLYDTVKILKNNDGLTAAQSVRVYENIQESDGYTDDSKVYVTYQLNTMSQLPVDPEVFAKTISNNSASMVFYKKYTDSDSLIRYNLMSTGEVMYADNYSTKNAIELARNNFPVNKLFYATADMKFYQIQIVNGAISVEDVSTDYLAYKGRQDLNFQYLHNANNNRRLDPAVSNLIDCYIMVRSYDEQYRNYISDTTGSVTKPVNLDTVNLNNNYSNLFNFKMISDELILNAGVYKPLFGSKAHASLQANFYVVKNQNTTISDNELKSRIISNINQYFALENWDFGDTFYFSELSAYIHGKLPGLLNSIVLAPMDDNSVFGSLYEIRCQPNEIFISAATVDNIKVQTGVLSGINNAGINLLAVAQ